MTWWIITAWAGPAFVRWAVREERGQIYCAPEVLEITNRYNENDGVSKRVHELAFGIVICFVNSWFCQPDLPYYSTTRTPQRVHIHACAHLPILQAKCAAEEHWQCFRSSGQKPLFESWCQWVWLISKICYFKFCKPQAKVKVVQGKEREWFKLEWPI